jgi:hypothetical protein
MSRANHPAAPKGMPRAAESSTLFELLKSAVTMT